ncbi:ktr2p [Saccharomyces arboricola H-6]|uniref:Ktr2p n=1 Tax=Saccharomyces arboricola (strain H-6 / AS 2.3317 / CBS 10644) TaxID=1160507 RepID=J8PL20_SACAR|nr:ktr2p [Saccharomyces arboricola H-6]
MQICKVFLTHFRKILLGSLLLCLIAQTCWVAFVHHQRQLKLDSYFLERSRVATSKYDFVRKRESNQKLKLSSNTYSDWLLDEPRETTLSRENATLLMLVRNWELPEALRSMRSLEDRFNKDFHYDWTFLNDVPFDENFIEATTAMASGKTQYALIPAEDWDRSSWINETLFEETLKMMEEKNVLYGSSKSYRNMCRFNSGFFFRQKILDQYDYYFRVEPDVTYFCDFPYDPFKVMRLNNKKYGFVITMYEYEDTIPTLWEAVEEYLEETESQDVDMETNGFEFISNFDFFGKSFGVVDSNSDYNLCHFWTNFEIGDLNFFRSEKYIKFFEYLDSKGGFYYERWGDAPVHSIAVSLLLKKDEVIHFDELGYKHMPFGTCPSAHYLRLQERCLCDSNHPDNIDLNVISCLRRWWKDGSGKYFLKHNS